MTAPALDEAKLEQFMGSMIGHMTGGALCFGVWLGDELGFYRAMSGGAPITSDELAEATDTNPRLVREWLDGQVAGGLIGYDAAAQTYTQSPEATLALADDSSPVFVARGMNAFASLFIDHAKIRDAYRGDGGLAWGDHHPCLFSGTEWFFRTGYRAYLPAVDPGPRRGRREAPRRGAGRRHRLRSRGVGRRPRAGVSGGNDLRLRPARPVDPDVEGPCR